MSENVHSRLDHTRPKIMNRSVAVGDPTLPLGDLFWEAVDSAQCAWRSWRPSQKSFQGPFTRPRTTQRDGFAAQRAEIGSQKLAKIAKGAKTAKSRERPTKHSITAESPKKFWV